MTKQKAERPTRKRKKAASLKNPKKKAAKHGAASVAPSAWPAASVEMRPAADLNAYARNARTHSEKQVEQIAESIREWGWTVPILIDETGTIIAGHGRVLAADLLKIESVPVMVAHGWSEAKKRAYMIADNAIALDSEWDDLMLGVEMDELDDLGFDLDLIGMDIVPLDPVPDPASPPKRPRVPAAADSPAADAATDPDATQADTARQALGQGSSPHQPSPDGLEFGAATALERSSGPMRFWREQGLIPDPQVSTPAGGPPHITHLDFGCGKEETAENRFDPFHAPNYDLLLRSWDVITCNYVLNVQPSDHLIIQIAALVRGMLRPSSSSRGTALFAVWNAPHSGIKRSGKGWQNAKNVSEWAELLDTFFGVQITKTTGTFFAFVCTPKRPPKH